MIYHITDRHSWEKFFKKDFYKPGNFEAEGFIHTCSREQVNGVLERYYNGKTELVLLHIDQDKVKFPIKYELSPSVNEKFPHIYGPLNIDAIVEIESINN